MNTYVFSCGDINGIGPEIIIKTLNKIRETDNRFIVIIPINSFETACSIIKPEFSFEVSSYKIQNTDAQVNIIPLKKTRTDTGQPTKYSGKASFLAIKKSFELVKKKKTSAMITAPISKFALQLAGINYPGHTEMLAEWSGARDYVMMFLSDNLKAALYSIHIPISKVPKSLTAKKLKNRIKIVADALQKDLGIKYPKIAVLGLNPHAGESGLIGKEEKRIITPVLKEIPGAEGPFPADGFFGSGIYKKYDAVFGMYHDQVLIPFKLKNFNSGVNYTAGLPIIRTSPDHGTAYDIAGTGKADESSMVEAFHFAQVIARNRKS